MSVLVDTPVWSELFRRAAPEHGVQRALRELIESGEALLIGPIRQELLSGVRDPRQFGKLRRALRAFPDEPIETVDYESAATCFNRCRSSGIQGSNTDFLICAIALRLGATIFTLDQDFQAFESVLSIRLFRLPEDGSISKSIG